MKSTLSWLKDHLDTKASVAEIADTLTRIGLEVEEVFDPATALASFKVAKVLKCEKHPNADKLQVCEVDTGTERLQVVCGAPNAREGLKGVFAPVGSYVPGIDLTLTKAKIRGVESNGMLLSERELELSDEHSGIIELSPDAKVGSRRGEGSRSRRRGDRDRHYAKPTRLPRRARRRPRPCRCRPRQAQARPAQAGQGQLPQSGSDQGSSSTRKPPAPARSLPDAWSEA